MCGISKTLKIFYYNLGGKEGTSKQGSRKKKKKEELFKGTVL